MRGKSTSRTKSASLVATRRRRESEPAADIRRAEFLTIMLEAAKNTPSEATFTELNDSQYDDNFNRLLEGLSEHQLTDLKLALLEQVSAISSGEVSAAEGEWLAYCLICVAAKLQGEEQLDLVRMGLKVGRASKWPLLSFFPYGRISKRSSKEVAAQLTREFWNAAGMLKYDKNRASAIQILALAPLPDELWEEAFATASTIQDTKLRDDTLIAFTRFGSPVQRARALALVGGGVIITSPLSQRTHNRSGEANSQNDEKKSKVAIKDGPRDYKRPGRAADGTETSAAEELSDQYNEISNDQILALLSKRGVSVELCQRVAADLIAGKRPRPLWEDRHDHEELSHLNAPRFLKAVYSDLFDAEGILTNEEAVRLRDPSLVQVVQNYMNDRERAGKGPGDAKGITFARKDDRGRPRAARRRQRNRSPLPA